MNTATHPNNEKLSQFVWTAFILLFFGLQAILWTVAISRTAGDTSHAVVAGYDEQALRWDEVRDAKLASEQLGWNAMFEFASTTDIRGNRGITLSITDKENNPIDAATVSLSTFHYGAAADVQQLDFEQTAPGKWTGTMAFRKPGFWQFSGSAKSANDTFLIEEKIWLEGGN